MSSTLRPATATPAPPSATAVTALDRALAAGPLPRISPRDLTRALWICFFAWTFAVYDFVLFGNLLPELAAAAGWTSARSTGVNTWVTVGTALVAFGVGPMVDRLGRRKGILIAVVGAAAASAATAAAGLVAGAVAGLGAVLIVLVRSLAGLGYAEQAINATYLNELFEHTHTDPARARRRGLVYSLVQSGWPVGSVLAAVSVYVLFPIGGWWLPFVVAAFPALLVAGAARWLKESPQFAARRRIGQLRSAGDGEAADALADHLGMPRVTPPASIGSAFRGTALRSTIFIGLPFMLNWFGCLVFALLGTSLLTAPDGKAITFDNALAVLAVSNVTAFVGYLAIGWLGDRIGRRTAIAISWVLASAAFSGLLLAPRGNVPVVLTFYALGLFFLIGSYAALLFFTAESFPLAARATGGAIVNAAGQMGAVLAGLGVTATLAAGADWTQAAWWWGVLPVLLSGLTILGARKVDPARSAEGTVHDEV